MKKIHRTQVQVGDIVTRCPTFGVRDEDKRPTVMKGKVVYVHPLERFHVVEFGPFGSKSSFIYESFSGVAFS